MHTIYLGYSAVLSGDEMIRYFDIDPDHEEGISKFEQSFGSEYIEPGSFEVYDRKEYEEFWFDVDIFAKLAPFEPDSGLVSKIDFSSAKSIFYIETSIVAIKENDVIKLIGPMTISKFDFE
ncbi:hypothetical protein CFBP6625_21835 [Agrobacterium tumefaciens]|nr:hypothetical protein [Agrobacterium sp. BT-220-3]QCM13003.1 hypothetical protein CFBP6625_21835 [Agrobacterium tumefaciens]